MSHLNERLIESLKYLDVEMRKDKQAGRPWKYTNKKKRYNTFEAARKNNRYTNCVSGVQFAFHMIGLPNATTHWYGAGGNICYTTKAGRETVPQYFDIIKVNDTVQNLFNKQQLCDGDVLIYTDMNHTNAYLGQGQSFDSGHAYCSSSGEMAVFTKWVGGLAHKNKRVSLILRLKDRAYYRVQVGAFTTDEKFNEMSIKLNNAGYKTLEIKEGGYRKIQVGYFAGKTNAENYAAQLAAKGFPAIVVEASATPTTPISPTPTPAPAPQPEPTPAPVPTPAKSIGYRVQVGAFKKPTERDKVGTNIKKKLNLDTFWEKQGDTYYLYCGSFSDKAVADARVAQLQSNGFSAFIKEIKV